MNSLYKRLVSIGMISFTALLGWVYCIIEFRDKPVYVICVSVALIISVYVLLRSVISIRQRKDKKLKKDINEAVAKLVADFYEAQAQAEQPDNSLEVERICKALYVQLRKVNTTLSNDLITKEILNNATKVNIKYNHADSSKLLAAISDLSESLKLAPEPQVIIKEVPIAAPQPAQAAPVQAVVPEPVVAPEPEPVTSVEPEPVAPADDGGVLSQEALDELLSSMNTATEAAPEPEPVKEAAPVPADDGGVLSQEALDALLASMNTTTEAASEPDADKTETTAIPENVGASSAEAQSFFDEFEAKHEHTSEQGNASSSVQADAPAPAPADDGGVLSQAELDALLASMGPAPEPVAEPEPEPVSNVLEFPTPAQEPAPVSDDPNKVLSPEEIAALFNSMK